MEMHRVWGEIKRVCDDSVVGLEERGEALERGPDREGL